MTNPYEQFAPSARATQAINPYAQFASAGANPYAQFAPQQQQSIGQRIGQDLANRVQVGNNIVNSPDLNPIVKPIAYVGNVGAGLANDVIKEGMKSVGSVIPQPVKDMASGAADLLREGASYIPGARAYSDAVAATPDMSKQYPNAAALAQSVGNVAKLGGSLAGMAQAAGMARQGINAASDAMPGMKQPPAGPDGGGAFKPLNNPKNIKITKDEPNAVSQAIDVEKQKAYNAVADSGAARTSQAVDSFLSDAAKNKAFNPDTFTSASDKSALNLVGSLNEELSGKPMSIARAQALDQDIATRKNAAFKRPDAPDQRLGYQYAAIQQALRDNIYKNPDASTFIGSPEAWNGLQEGNRLHSQYMKAKTVENLYQNGAEKAVPSTSIQTQMGLLAKKIRNSGKGQLGYTDAQVEAINKSAESGIIEPALRTMGSKLIGPLVGAMLGEPTGVIGSFLGMGAGHIAGAPFRAGATALRTMKVEDVLRSIVKDPYYNKLEQLPPTPPAPLQITGPGAVMTADSEGNISRTPNPANEVVNTQPRPITPQNIPPAYQPTPSPQMKMLPSPNSARPMSDAEIAQYQDLLKNGSPKTGGVPVGNPEGNPVPNAQSTVRNPNDGLLDKAIKEPIGTATQNEGYQNLTWIKQRQIDKLIPQYTSNALSKAQVVRQMSQVGLSVQDADEILSSAYQSKIWRNGQLKLTPAEIAKLSPKQAADYLKNNK